MAARSRISLEAREKYASEDPLERRIKQFANRQLQLITTTQLHRAGLTDWAVSHRATRGRLHRMHHGVYATNLRPGAANSSGSVPSSLAGRARC